MMSNYYIKKLDNAQYFLVCIDYHGLATYVDEVENDCLIQSNEGSLIIDQLLVAGNGKNRFFSCDFSYGKINFNTAKRISGTDIFRRTTSELLLNQTSKDLKYSILTDYQLELLYKGKL